MERRSYTDDDLAAAVRASRSWRAVLRSLGLSATSAAAIRSVRGHVDRLGLDTAHFTGQRRWSEHELAQAVASAHSWGEVTTRLGLAGGSSTTNLKGHAARLGLDVSHLAQARRPPLTPGIPLSVDPGRLPRAGSLWGAAALVLCGFDVAWPLEPAAYDLLAERDGTFLRVQVKTTRVRRAGSWVVTLSTTRGSRRTYDPDEIDYFLVVDGDLECYLIPVGLVGGLHVVSLSGLQDCRMALTETSRGPAPPDPAHS